MSEPDRTVLFIVTSFWAYGELAIATEFARQMPGSGYRPLFLIPPSHRAILAETGIPHEVLIPGAGRINQIQLKSIQSVHRPALVVLADFLNFDFCDRHYGLRRSDLDVFSCPIGTFDDFTWGRPDSWLDTYGFRAKYESAISMDGLSFRLRPCPLNNPLSVPDGPGTYAHALFDPNESWLDTTVDPLAVRAELGVPPDRPLVLLTSATWQQMHVAYPRVGAFVGAATAMLERLLSGLLEHASVVVVGPRLVFPTNQPRGLICLGQLSPSRFRRLAAAVDLHLSNNIVSVSLHRLALAGIPSIAVLSSLVKSEGTVRWLEPGPHEMSAFAAGVVSGVDYLYPVRMFPVGWYHFLRSLMAGNPFTDLITHVELFQEERALQIVLPMLAPGPDREAAESARTRYREALCRLPSVPAILAEIGASVPAAVR